MTSIRRILCPVDFSRFSHHALEQAIDLAHEFDAEVVVLHASAVAPVTALAPIGAPIPLEPARLTREERRLITTQLHEFTGEVDAGGLMVSSRLVEQEPVAAIIDAAAAWPADLIVLGTHGRTGFERLMLGSVSEKVLRKASCPVLTVPQRTFSVRHRLTAGPILCPIDFSAASLRALEYATSIAAPDGAGVHVLNVIELFAEGGGMRDELVLDTPDFRAALIHHAQHHLHEAVNDAMRRGCPITESVVMGKAYLEILRVAAAAEAALIVLGVRGRSPADLLLFGSTTQHVVRQSQCPVLTAGKEMAS
jgi:nucleotide-binding universal stress UspA family protein